jgi:hypothetical protein
MFKLPINSEKINDKNKYIMCPPLNIHKWKLVIEM